MTTRTLADFERSLAAPQPPSGLAPALAALWWERKNSWAQAHDLVMDEAGRDCAWVHAYLHRVEGDLDNARYWYGKAGRRAATDPVAAEWERIARALLPGEETR
jgi:hypothetical protein